MVKQKEDKRPFVSILSNFSLILTLFLLIFGMGYGVRDWEAKINLSYTKQQNKKLQDSVTILHKKNKELKNTITILTKENKELKDSINSVLEINNKNQAIVKKETTNKFMHPAINIGYIRVANFDKSNKEWFGVSINIETNLTINLIENLKGEIYSRKNILLYRNKPKTFTFGYSKNVEFIDKEIKFVILSNVFKFEKNNIIQFWYKVKK